VLETRAKAGDLQAQYDLGERYLHGIHISEDPAKGIYWLTRAAEAGHLAAQLSLGDYYLMTGEREKARLWIERLANSKNYGWERLNAQSRLPSVLDTHPGSCFGIYNSKAEIDRATQLLREANISFQVKVGTSDPEKGWPGPFDLWVQGDKSKEAEAVLASHSQSQKK
jgi:TPR repeat protein